MTIPTLVLLYLNHIVKLSCVDLQKKRENKKSLSKCLIRMSRLFRSVEGTGHVLVITQNIAEKLT